MAYTVIRGRTERVNKPSPPQSTGPSFKRIGEVTTVVGAPVDFGSWLKNLGQIRENPADFNSWVGFGTDTLKLLNAAKELALKSPLFPKTGALIELVNKADKIVEDLNNGKGVALGDAIGIFGEALGIASEVKLFPIPAQLGLKAGGIGLSAVAQIESLGNVRIGASEPRVLPVPSRFSVVGYDFYKSADGSAPQVVETSRDNETGQLTQRHYDSSQKLVMTVKDLGNNKYEVRIPGNEVPAILEGFNPLSNQNLIERFGPPAKGGLSDPSGTTGQFSDAVDYLIDEAITAELAEQFPGIDAFGVDYAVLDGENTVAWSDLDETALEQGQLVGDDIRIRLRQGDAQVVLLASADATLSDAGNGFFEAKIETINGVAPPAGAYDLDPQDLEAWGFTFQNLTSGDPLPSTATALVEGLAIAAGSPANAYNPAVVSDIRADGNTHRSIELPNGVTLTTISSPAGNPLRVEETRFNGNEATTTSFRINEDGSRIATTLTTGVYSSGGGFVGRETDLVTNTVYRIIRETDGTETRTPDIAATQNLTNQQVTTVLSDINALVGAIKGGKPLPILASGLTLLNNQINPTVDGTYVVNNGGLSTATGIAGGLLSLYNLHNALENGSDLDRVNATLNTLNYVNSTLPKLLGNAAPLNETLNGVLNGAGGAPGVLPVLGLVLSIKSGDPIGIFQGIMGLVNPAFLSSPVGWALIGIQILRSILDEPPEAWGNAKVVFGDDGLLKIDTVGEAFGPDRVRQQLQVSLDVLNGMIAQAQTSNPNNTLGLVPQRLPQLTWREARQADMGYALLDIDPVTGEQRYPYLRFDDNGVPFSTNPELWQPDPRDPNIRAGLTGSLINSGLLREAIAAQWEVATARIQQTVDANAATSCYVKHSALRNEYHSYWAKRLGKFGACRVAERRIARTSTNCQVVGINFGVSGMDQVQEMRRLSGVARKIGYQR
jgi:hypothetical protein